MKIQYESAGLVVFESSLYRTTTTLVLGTDYLVLVDPNWLPREVDFIAEYVSRYRSGRQAFLLFTHSDYDHIIAYERFADFTVIASRAFVDNPKREEILAEIRAFDDQYYIERDYAITYPTVDLPVATDGELIPLGEQARMRVYQAPGHNADGIFAYLGEHQLLIVGDYLCNVEFPFIYHSLAAYRNTLEKLSRLLATHSIRWLVAGHGDLASEQEEMTSRLVEANRYLDELERQVRTDQPFPLADWLAAYPWPEGLRKAHLANLALATRELKST